MVAQLSGKVKMNYVWQIVLSSTLTWELVTVYLENMSIMGCIDVAM